MNISHHTGRLSRRRAASRSRLPLLHGCPAMVGLSAPAPGGPPNEVERQPADRQAEQRNPPHTPGTGVSAA